MTTLTDTPECIHGLIGCAPCQGIDEATGPREPRAHGVERSWTSVENQIAGFVTLSSRQVANILGRSVHQVSAHRLGVLKMTDYRNYRPHPHS